MIYLKLGLIVALVLVLFIELFPTKVTQNLGPLYLAKRFQEKAFLSLKSDPNDRADYLLYLLDQRAQEIESMVLGRHLEYTLESSLRYSSTAGQLTETLLQNNLKDKKPLVLERFKNHQAKFKPLLDHYPMDNTERKYLEDDINYLTIYSEQLGKL